MTRTGDACKQHKYQSFFAAVFQKKRIFFSEEKKQKTFIYEALPQLFVFIIQMHQGTIAFEGLIRREALFQTQRLSKTALFPRSNQLRI